MTSISYEEIYSSFLATVEAYDLTSMVEANANLMMNQWIRSVKANPRVRKMFKSISLNDEIEGLEELSFELKVSQGDEESDKDYVTSLFGIGIAWKWVSPKYLSILNSAQMLSGKEVSWYSQANHMSELKKMYDGAKRELYNMVKDYGTSYNGYLGD